MQSKAILSKRIKLGKISRRFYTIGVFGLHQGAGVTHTVLLLAHFLGNICGREVVVMEASGRADLASLSNVFKVKQSNENLNEFICRNITFIINAANDDMDDIRSSKHEYCILDFGSNYRKAMNKLVECDLKLMIYNNAPWHHNSQKLLEDLLRSIHDTSTWCLLRNLSNAPPMLKKTVPIKQYWMGFEPNHFYVSNITKKTLKKVLHTVL